MNGGNYRMDPTSMFSFDVFLGYWDKIKDVNKGDTIIGNDVWIGHFATFLTGVHVGDGANMASILLSQKMLIPIH